MTTITFMKTTLTKEQQGAIEDFFSLTGGLGNISELMDNILQDALYNNATTGGEHSGDYYLFFRLLKKMVAALEPKSR